MDLDITPMGRSYDISYSSEAQDLPILIFSQQDGWFFRAKLQFRPNSAQVVLIFLGQLLILCFITIGGRELIITLNKVSEAL